MKMTSRTSKAVVLASATVLIAGLAGCGSGSGSSGAEGATNGGTIAFAPNSAQVPVVTELGNQVSAYMKSQGIKVITQDANFDPGKQASQLTTAINNGQIKAAWIFPVAPEALKSTIAAAQAKKIPLVVEASPSDFGFDGPQKGIIFDSASFADYGKKIAEETADCVNSAGATQVLLLEAPGVAGGQKTVHDSILSEFAAKAPGAKIVGRAQAQDTATAQTKVSQLLIAHPEATAVIAASDETALGAVQAFAGAGKKPACLIGGGGSPDAQAALKAGKLTSIVAWDFTAAVKTAGADLIKLLSDPTAEGIINDTPITVLK